MGALGAQAAPPAAGARLAAVCSAGAYSVAGLGAEVVVSRADTARRRAGARDRAAGRAVTVANLVAARTPAWATILAGRATADHSTMSS